MILNYGKIRSLKNKLLYFKEAQAKEVAYLLRQQVQIIKVKINFKKINHKKFKKGLFNKG
jgi:hypothetical protein